MSEDKEGMLNHQPAGDDSQYQISRNIQRYSVENILYLQQRNHQDYFGKM